MTTATGGQATVLVVDDERALADLYAEWLRDEYAVRTAYDGEEALAEYDPSVDIVLLDRRMPQVSGDDVLAEIRERESSAQVVMVTAVDPDFDILKMGFDEYLTKPVSKPDLQEVVDQVLARRAYGDQLRTYHQLVAKRATLESTKPAEELEATTEFSTLQDRITTLEAELETSREAFDAADFEAAFRQLD